MKHEAQELIANTMQVSGAVTATASGLSGFIAVNHDIIWFFGVIVGGIVGVGGLLLNWYYKQKHYNLASKSLIK